MIFFEHEIKTNLFKAISIVPKLSFIIVNNDDFKDNFMKNR
mgnify:CR=1 FL=1